MAVGVRGVRGVCGVQWFHTRRPTDVAVNPKNGEFFVTDGYGNSRVHRFKADGTHIMSASPLACRQHRCALLLYLQSMCACVCVCVCVCVC